MDFDGGGDNGEHPCSEGGRGGDPARLSSEQCGGVPDGNGDGVADFEIQLTITAGMPGPMTVADFML